MNTVFTVADALGSPFLQMGWNNDHMARVGLGEAGSS